MMGFPTAAEGPPAAPSIPLDSGNWTWTWTSTECFYQWSKITIKF